MSPSDADGGSMKSGQLYECLAIVDCNTNSILEHSSSLVNCVSGTWGRPVGGTLGGVFCVSLNEQLTTNNLRLVKCQGLALGHF